MAEAMLAWARLLRLGVLFLFGVWIASVHLTQKGIIIISIKCWFRSWRLGVISQVLESAGTGQEC
eukprot:1411500-Amphidinium_carterae.1